MEGAVKPPPSQPSAVRHNEEDPSEANHGPESGLVASTRCQDHDDAQTLSKHVVAPEAVNVLTSHLASFSEESHSTCALPGAVTTTVSVSSAVEHPSMSTLFSSTLPSPTPSPSMAKASEQEDKKTGRPSHPAWEHFIRGEKRNRFHHHAYCRYCAANGVEPVAIRGVSGNMIRHLQKCIYCPEEIVTQLKLMCAQKDAENFSKRHHAVSGEVDALLGDHSTALSKRLKRNPDQGNGANLAARKQMAGAGRAGEGHARHARKISELASEEMQRRLTSSTWPRQYKHSLSSSIPALERHADGPKLRDQVKRIEAHQDDGLSPAGSNLSNDPLLFNRLVLNATIQADLPLSWLWYAESKNFIHSLDSSIQVPTPTQLFNSDAFASIVSTSWEKQIVKMQEDPVGVSLAVNCWMCADLNSFSIHFSLMNALGEASSHSLVEIGANEALPEVISVHVKTCLDSLLKRNVQVINIVTNCLAALKASKLATSEPEAPYFAVPVIPCFSHLLINLLGAILTASEPLLETMGNVIELVRFFSNHQVLSFLQREIGDTDAVLLLPTNDNWYSFIECIESVRQYEDFIKLLVNKMESSTTETKENPIPEENEDTLKHSTAFPRAIVELVQSPIFWENVISLSELMSPIKESHKVVQNSHSSFGLGDCMYQLSRMHQQYGLMTSDWDENAYGRRQTEHARFLQDVISKMWDLYDHPLVILGFTFNYNLDASCLARNHPSLQWLSIAKCAKDYFRRWFGASNRTNSRLSLGDSACSQFLEDLLAFKDRKHPFDLESFCEFENPRYFYMLICDSNPLMHIFGARLFSMKVMTPSLERIVPGKRFTMANPVLNYPKSFLVPILQLKLFAHTAIRPSRDVLATVQAMKFRYVDVDDSGEFREDLARHVKEDENLLNPGLESMAKKTIWTKTQWTRLAHQWKAQWTEEIRSETTVDELSFLDPNENRLAAPVSIDQVFKDLLPSRLTPGREAVVDV